MLRGARYYFIQNFLNRPIILFDTGKSSIHQTCEDVGLAGKDAMHVVDTQARAVKLGRREV